MFTFKARDFPNPEFARQSATSLSSLQLPYAWPQTLGHWNPSNLSSPYSVKSCKSNFLSYRLPTVQPWGLYCSRTLWWFLRLRILRNPQCFLATISSLLLLSVAKDLLIAFLQCHRSCLVDQPARFHPPSSYLLFEIQLWSLTQACVIGYSRSGGFRSGSFLVSEEGMPLKVPYSGHAKYTLEGLPSCRIQTGGM